MSIGLLPNSGKLECDRLGACSLQQGILIQSVCWWPTHMHMEVYRPAVQSSNVVEWHTAVQEGATVWGVISWDTQSPLVILLGTIMACRYVGDILTSVVLPILSSRSGAIYQHDNTCPDTCSHISTIILHMYSNKFAWFRSLNELFKANNKYFIYLQVKNC